MLGRSEIKKYYFCGQSLSSGHEAVTADGHNRHVISRVLDNFVRADHAEDADVLLVSEHNDSLREFWKDVQSSHIRVFLPGEAVFPDFNIFDFAVGFDHFSFGDRYLRLHPSVRYGDSFAQKNPAPVAENSPEGREFCDFIYSNPLAHPMRDKVYHRVNEYRSVASLGWHLNTGDTRFLRDAKKMEQENWVQTKIEAQKRFKFSIAVENAIYAGYTSEKIITSFHAGQIPIYWGNPLISLDFNPQRFLNLHEFGSLDDAVEAISVIDTDDDRWRAMVAQPVHTEAQVDEISAAYDDALLFFQRVFDSAESEAPRRGVGYFPAVWEGELRRSRQRGGVMAKVRRFALFQAVPLRWKIFARRVVPRLSRWAGRA